MFIIETMVTRAIGDCIGAAVLRFTNAAQTLDIVRDYWLAAFMLHYATMTQHSFVVDDNQVLFQR
jgi:hypothetical protein